MRFQLEEERVVDGPKLVGIRFKSQVDFEVERVNLETAPGRQSCPKIQLSL